ncbi:hypothetical protein FOXB_12665 [Fusarium oxysporum f. sp. conglutinans Fo5176]|uniref:Uncharacterized protein n=1 Tax=Fusarium oxysporum (strain Fo5176) TaxID=660025 RepID=F9G1Y3_FUSOF|nr:hypothetical protein FOXB_12665 [Fusarium oxysporum f. sp. conglutinans Fo5176]
MCISKTGESTEENLLFMGEHTAPWANMAPVRRPPRLNIWKDFGIAEFQTSNCEVSGNNQKIKNFTRH